MNSSYLNSNSLDDVVHVDDLSTSRDQGDLLLSLQFSWKHGTPQHRVNSDTTPESLPQHKLTSDPRLDVTPASVCLTAVGLADHGALVRPRIQLFKDLHQLFDTRGEPARDVMYKI